MEKKTVKRILILVKVIVTILFVSVVNKALFTREEGLSGLLPMDLLLWAIGFSVISTFLQGWRWMIFLRMFGMDASLGQAMRSYLEGVLFALITPGRAGELLRGYSLKPEWLKLSSVAVVVERLWATVVLFIVGGIAYFFLPDDKGGSIYTLGITIALTLSAIAVVVIPLLIKNYLSKARLVRRRFISSFLLSTLIHLILLIQL